VTGVVVDGLTIQGGHAMGNGTDSGGGILLTASGNPASATVSRCEITANAASAYGGGLSVGSMGATATTIITDCNIHDNTAGKDGGGMLCGGDCTVTGTTFKANSASNGAGLLVNADKVALDHDTFIGNFTMVSDGGGMLLLGHPAGTTFTNLIFQDNHAVGLGGAVYSNNSAVAFSNGLFAGNSASGGGAIASDTPGGFSCINCTITGNHANQGDGIKWSNGAPTIANSIVWGNPSHVTAGNHDVFPNDWATVITSHSDIGGYSGDGSRGPGARREARHRRLRAPVKAARATC
jgi:hypothetical protein